MLLKISFEGFKKTKILNSGFWGTKSKHFIYLKF